jgi:hypothetical protein
MGKTRKQFGNYMSVLVDNKNASEQKVSALLLSGGQEMLRKQNCLVTVVHEFRSTPYI